MSVFMAKVRYGHIGTNSAPSRQSGQETRPAPIAGLRTCSICLDLESINFAKVRSARTVAGHANKTLKTSSAVADRATTTGRSMVGSAPSLLRCHTLIHQARRPPHRTGGGPAADIGISQAQTFCIATKMLAHECFTTLHENDYVRAVAGFRHFRTTPWRQPRSKT